MRRRLLYILSLMMLFGASCADDPSEQGETSLVTISVGRTGQSTGAEGAVSAAAIPSSVSTISFTISAFDMDTITRDVSVSGGDEITETFEIPNGNSRHILVAAKDSSGAILYLGENTIDVDGTDVSVTIEMVCIDSWARSYGGFGSDMYTTIQQTSDGGYVVVGESKSFGAGQSDYWVLKLKNDGNIDWQKTYGGPGDDLAHAVQQTTDGGYVVAGRSDSFDPEGGADIWILKLNGGGDIAWQKSYGASGEHNWDWAYSIQQTTDGGYVVGGRTISWGCDFWILKLNSDGTIAWQKTYDPGTNSLELFGSMKQTSDGGYIVAGISYLDSDNFNLWALKLDGNGAITWEKAYGGNSNEWVFYPDSIQETSDGGYIIASETESFGAGGSDFWVLKLKSNGAIEWQKTYGGAGGDRPRTVVQTSDGGYIVSGDTDSFDAGDADFWVLKLNSNGTIAWQKTYGGSLSEYFPTIQQTSDGGYIVGGETLSFGAGDSDFWVLKLNSDGTVPNFGADTSITGVDTSVSHVNTSASIEDTSISPSDTNATVTVTSATVEQQAP